METATIYSVEWFKQLTEKINQLEKQWKYDIVKFNKSILMEEHKAAQLLQISIKTFRRYCQRNYFTVYRIGHRNFILQHDFIRGIINHLAK